MLQETLNELSSSNFSMLNDCFDKISTWLKDSSITEEDKQEILTLIKNKKTEELRDRFYRDLEFGTGGMRGVIGMGANRLNKYVIRRAVQGVANYIKKFGSEGCSRGVAIAHDSRHFSNEFAKEAASVLAANGIKAFLFPTLQTTPCLSFAIRKLNCISGFCITASHNPPQYNGIKVYWDYGSQIIPPQDEEILSHVFALKNYSEAKCISFNQGVDQGLIHYISDEILNNYFDDLNNLSILKNNSNKDFEIVYTPLHGTGKIPTLRALNNFGFKNVFVVPEQAEPNGNFPTVKKPNPEEADALSLAISYATARKSQYVFATDPDSDRLGIAVYDPIMAKGLLKSQAKDDFIILNGNQTASLLIDFILKTRKNSGTLKPQHKIVKTIVTSDLVANICSTYGVECFNTLTGFKWIAGLVQKWEKEKNGFEYLFGTEESFGYMPNNNVRDKDAIGAMCQAAEMLAFLTAQNKSPCEYLFEIFAKYGAWQEHLINVDLYGEEGSRKIAQMMQTMREKPIQEWCGEKVVNIIDYLTPEVQNKYQIAKSNVLQFLLADGSKISMRPSGTEPKLKFYLSVCTKETDTKVAYQKTLNKIDILSKEVHRFINLF
ncbi:phospho-sugar mutase [Pigmentibacter sp. JX0631]|uniref:phospho-sugar mutase n=1 Tax=Pigmentibacter sp. JX0631 TaxID=2976982 RepID=UPI002469457F|nr:phospho-sugar mutase [Pigmentibacter sp. JX0631]WGL59085.1 phospho-sugar mutase [Pigmentibacter sp. JX0631]